VWGLGLGYTLGHGYNMIKHCDKTAKTKSMTVECFIVVAAVARPCNNPAIKQVYCRCGNWRGSVIKGLVGLLSTKAFFAISIIIVIVDFNFYAKYLTQKNRFNHVRDHGRRFGGLSPLTCIQDPGPPIGFAQNQREIIAYTCQLPLPPNTLSHQQVLLAFDRCQNAAKSTDVNVKNFREHTGTLFLSRPHSVTDSPQKKNLWLSF